MTPATDNLFDAITDCNVQGVQDALKSGADVNARHRLGKLTPLHFTCMIHGWLAARDLRRSDETEAIAQILLDAGADPTLRDAAGHLAKLAGLDADCQRPNVWAKGAAPRCVTRRMEELTAQNKFPAPDPDGHANPLIGGKVGSHIARGIAFRERRKAAA
jgi:hypothetical protein